ncbi:MAG: DNA internalization-related competence protein ComEC/Rec2 [Bacillota bacterium]|jgi:competence protein ComEC
MQRVLLFHTIGFALGIALGNVLNIPVHFAFLCALISAIMSLVIIWFRGSVKLTVIFTLAVGVFWVQVNSFQYLITPFFAGDQVEIQGLALSNPVPAGSGQVFTLRPDIVNGQEYTGSGRINIFAEEGQVVHYGDVVKIKGKVLPENGATNPNQFDYGAYLKRKGVVAAVSTAYGGSITLIERDQGNFFLKQVYTLKNKMDMVLAHLPPRQQGFVSGMLFGEKNQLTYQERNVLSQTGLMDAFAVSGMHVGFVVLLAGYLAHIFQAGKWGRLFAVGLAVLFYAAVTGFTASVVRSGLMAVIGLLAYSLGEEKDVPTAMAVAALPILVYRPLDLFDAGFQLSFIAAWGVIYLTPMTKEWLPGKGPLAQALAAAIAAQLALAPLIAYYFNVLTLAGLVLGILVAAPVGLVVLLGLVSLIFCPLSIEMASLPIYGAGLVTEIIWQVAQAVSRIPGAYFTVRTPHTVYLFIHYTILIFLPLLFKKKYGKQLSIAAGIVLIFFLALPVWGNNNLSVTFLDVGQGDCIFIESPSGRKVVIDGGGKMGENSADIGERIVVPFLKSKGIDTLDLVINTHPHHDHINGLEAVIREMKVGTFLTAVPFLDCPETRELIEVAEKKRTNSEAVSQGDIIVLEPGVELIVLAPTAQGVSGESNENSNSLVLKLCYQRISFLFTGDVEGDGLEELLKSGADIQADVLKLPHHGSKNAFSRDFYERASPLVTAITVGRNSFGHPHDMVVSYWEERGIPVYRTDLHGAVSMETDGTKIWIQTVKNPVP